MSIEQVCVNGWRQDVAQVSVVLLDSFGKTWVARREMLISNYCQKFFPFQVIYLPAPCETICG